MYTGSLTSDIYCLFLPVAGNLDAIKVQVSLPEDVVKRLEYYMLRVIIKRDKESPSAVKANVLTRAAPAAGGSHHRWERSHERFSWVPAIVVVLCLVVGVLVDPETIAGLDSDIWCLELHWIGDRSAGAKRTEHNATRATVPDRAEHPRTCSCGRDF
ncbi:hypothetical protein DY000_02008744 [Brassica cretica]|uniref:Uncharacterized protein n=1 Tax=Brassica cretica TaxID=69181 RepID=A0ABQ7C9T9_BRACR|nr:hypothetical protein DY000_02008744 [Brassica cretica]